uniref:Uncharacterized protein n=1 Tax=Rhizophora mucronata TaxID=61149 RepID=A0A2P2PME3_RHIMU
MIFVIKFPFQGNNLIVGFPYNNFFFHREPLFSVHCSFFQKVRSLMIMPSRVLLLHYSRQSPVDFCSQKLVRKKDAHDSIMEANSILSTFLQCNFGCE